MSASSTTMRRFLDASRELGVRATATKDEIKRAYRQRAVTEHPDVSGASPGLFRKVNAAREVLLDEENRRLVSAMRRRRRRYRQRKQAPAPAPPQGPSAAYRPAPVPHWPPAPAVDLDALWKTIVVVGVVNWATRQLLDRR